MCPTGTGAARAADRRERYAPGASGNRRHANATLCLWLCMPTPGYAAGGACSATKSSQDVPRFVAIVSESRPVLEIRSSSSESDRRTWSSRDLVSELAPSAPPSHAATASSSIPRDAAYSRATCGAAAARVVEWRQRQRHVREDMQGVARSGNAPALREKVAERRPAEAPPRKPPRALPAQARSWGRRQRPVRDEVPTRPAPRRRELDGR